MSDASQDGLFESENPLEAEGRFDEQLSLPWPGLAAPQPLRRLCKRDGREEPFDKTKIARAIRKASEAASNDEEVEAESLASAVAIYLSKRLQGAAATVDQVHDAVERVLIYMGHAETALAYARYRDRRGRIRRLRAGDMRQLLGELEEARDEREALAGWENTALVVRTRQGELTTWDREKIAQALVRETGLDQPLAQMIAIEVETQIERAHMQTLTVSLVRELVDAKLVEHGFWEYRERYRRLGVSLYDTERIMHGAAEAGVPSTPSTTDRVLAQAVKREFALAQVYRPHVGEAHLSGDLHLHHLGLADRLHAITQNLDDVARHGISLPEAPEFAAPARRAETLLAHMVKFSATLQGYFAEPVVWPAVNYYFAPYLRELDEPGIAQFAQMLVYEYAYRALTGSMSHRPTEIEVCWKAPSALADREAVGPGGMPMGRPYSAYAHTAEQLAWAIFDMLRRGGADGVSFPAPLPRVRIDDTFVKAPGRSAFLRQVAKLTAERKSVRYMFGRGEAAARGYGGRRVALQQVTLNLPRAAYRAQKEASFFETLDALVRQAVEGVTDKRDFLERLLMQETGGPLALLSAPIAGAPLVDIEQAQGRIAIEGLSECVGFLMNTRLEKSAGAAEFAERIVAFLAERCAVHGQRARVNLALAQNNAADVGRRFATLDVAAFPKSAGATVHEEPATHALGYTTGARLAAGHGLSPIEAVRLEGRFHAHLAAGARSEAPLPESDPGSESIADFIMKVHSQTQCHSVLFV
ncbi:MAG: anaerobic ribonucleoside-triphosphate reductase [Candidatus Hydrogenedentota bacterium]